MDIKDVIKLIKKRLWMIIAFVLIATVTTAGYTTRNYAPVYAASASLIVNTTTQLNQLGQTQMDLNAIYINFRLVNTYKEIIQTRAIMDKVVEGYPELNTTSEELLTVTNVTSQNETQVMTISAVSASYERAAGMVNGIAEVFRSEIPNILKVDNVTILNTAPLLENPIPINPMTNQSIFISFIAALLIALGVTFLLEFVDDKLKREKDIRDIFEVPALVIIPTFKGGAMATAKRKTNTKRVGDVHVAVKR